MARKDEHPAKGWAATFGRVSVAMPHLNQDSPETHTRVNRQTAAAYGLKIKPGYEFYALGFSGSKENVRLPDLEKAIKVVVNREIESPDRPGARPAVAAGDAPCRGDARRG